MADLARTLEARLITWLAESGTHSQTIGITAAHRDADATLPLPAIVCMVNVNGETIHSTGVYDCEMVVEYRSNADDTTASAASTVWAKIKYAMLWDVLATELSDPNNLKVWGAIWDGSDTEEIEDRSRIKRLSIRCIAQPSDNG